MADIPNTTVQSHGVRGSLMVKLQRYALLGWFLFFITFLFGFVFILADKISPTPVLAVDESGRVLGSFEYLSENSRSNDEIIAASKYFAQRCLSLNAATIFDEYAECLNMMSDSLRAAKLEEIKKIEYLQTISKQKSFSYIIFNDKKTDVVSRDGSRSMVRIAGNIIVNGKSELPFDITYGITVIPRTRLGTQGISVTNITDN